MHIVETKNNNKISSGSDLKRDESWAAQPSISGTFKQHTHLAKWLSSTSLVTGAFAAVLLVGVMATSPASAQQVWDPTANGVLNGGSGTWDAATTPNFTTDGGTTNVVYANPSNVAFSVGTGTDTVTVIGTVNIGDIDFQATGYTLTGGTLDIGGGVAVSSLNVSAGTTTINSIIAGTGSLLKLGVGTFTLSGANTYSNETRVVAGTLSLAGGAAIADTGRVSISAGATLDIQANETIGSLSGAGTVNLNATP